MTKSNATDTAAAPRPKALNPVVKLLLELGPLALFFAAYSKLGIFAATGVLMAAVLVTLGVSYALLRRIPIMPLVTASQPCSRIRSASTTRAFARMQSPGEVFIGSSRCRRELRQVHHGIDPT